MIMRRDEKERLVLALEVADLRTLIAGRAILYPP